MSFVNQYRSTTIYGELKVQKYNTGNINGLLDISGNSILRGDCTINGNLLATDGTLDISGNLAVTGDISGKLAINDTNNTNDFFRIPFLDDETSSSTLSSSAGLRYNPVSEQVNYTTLNGGDIYALDISCNNVNAANFIGNVSTTTEDATNASFYPTFVSAEGNVPLKVNSGITYNPFTETLTVTNFNGTITNNAATSTIAADATNASFFPTFVSATSGNLPLKVDSGISYNPSTNVLTLNSDAKINELTIGRGTGNVDTNTVLGKGALFFANTTGYENTAVGYEVLTVNTTGSSNTAVGYRSSVANTTGYENTAIGFEALTATTTGSSNISVGTSSMTDNITGSNNVAVGGNALDENTSGSFNVGIGDGAGRINKTGNNNTFLGYNTDISGNVVYNNSTAIGTGAIIDASNCIVIGTASETVKIRGGLTVTGSITGTASNVNITSSSTNLAYRIPFASTGTGSSTLLSDSNINFNPSTNTFSVDNITGTVSNVNVTAVATNASYRVPFLSGATGSQTISSDAGVTYNPSTNIFSADNISANSLNAPLSGVWFISGNNRTDLTSVMPLFKSESNFNDINNGLTSGSVTGATVGTLTNPFDLDNLCDRVIIMPDWGVVAYQDPDYGSLMRINFHNSNSVPVVVTPNAVNSISSAKIYYKKVEQT
jgi:hypothetical protein